MWQFLSAIKLADDGNYLFFNIQAMKNNWKFREIDWPLKIS